MNGQNNPEEEEKESEFDENPSDYSPLSFPIEKNKKVPIVVFCILAMVFTFVIVITILSNNRNDPAVDYQT